MRLPTAWPSASLYHLNPVISTRPTAHQRVALFERQKRLELLHEPAEVHQLRLRVPRLVSEIARRAVRNSAEMLLTVSSRSTISCRKAVIRSAKPCSSALMASSFDCFQRRSCNASSLRRWRGGVPPPAPTEAGEFLDESTLPAQLACLAPAGSRRDRLRGASGNRSLSEFVMSGQKSACLGWLERIKPRAGRHRRLRAAAQKASVRGSNFRARVGRTAHPRQIDALFPSSPRAPRTPRCPLCLNSRRRRVCTCGRSNNDLSQTPQNRPGWHRCSDLQPFAPHLMVRGGGGAFSGCLRGEPVECAAENELAIGCGHSKRVDGRGCASNTAAAIPGKMKESFRTAGDWRRTREGHAEDSRSSSPGAGPHPVVRAGGVDRISAHVGRHECFAEEAGAEERNDERERGQFHASAWTSSG